MNWLLRGWRQLQDCVSGLACGAAAEDSSSPIPAAAVGLASRATSKVALGSGQVGLACGAAAEDSSSPIPAAAVGLGSRATSKVALGSGQVVWTSTSKVEMHAWLEV